MFQQCILLIALCCTGKAQVQMQIPANAQLPEGYVPLPADSLEMRSNTTLANATSPSSSSQELVSQALHLIVGDASVVRLSSFEPNRSSACVWPECAPYCVPCAKTNKYWSCILDKGCQQNSECLVATCWSEPGYCYADAYPKKARCFMGAVPERPSYWLNDQILRFGWVSPVPRPERLDRWKPWILDALLFPLFFFCICIGIGVSTYKHLREPSGKDRRYLPKSPWPLIVMFGLSVLVLIGAEIYRQMRLDEDLSLVESKMHETIALVEKAKCHIRDLIDSEVKYNASLVVASETCGNANPLGTYIADMVAGKLSPQITETHVMLETVDVSLDEVIKLIHRFKETYLPQMKFWMFWGPKIPVLTFYAVVAAVLILTKGLGCMKLQGSMRAMAPVVLTFIVFTGLVAALDIFVAICMSGVCHHIDDNLVQLAEQTDLNALAPEQINVNGVLQHVARYYVKGLNVNPLSTLIQNVQAALYMLLHFYDQFRWVVDFVASGCPGLTKLDPAPIVAELLKGADTMLEFVHAKQVWGYYDRLVHESVCRKTPMVLVLSFWMLTFAAAVLIPILAIMASVHLQHQEFLQRCAEVGVDADDSDSDQNDLAEAAVSLDEILDDIRKPEHQAQLLFKIVHSREPAVQRHLELLEDDEDSSAPSR
eukprot:TRINITY_DN102740_c0_g1_i1.p1 TRINITY_DN102740_c0_g1~~TRINITY_DN102740_c0_g1_i1.p1  ORF type:complete len:655 (-),score=94.33 TRINITY_DN102740_c0_g1_i1:220-2184(-)